MHLDEGGERITGVDDRWNGNIPEGAFAKVSFVQLLSLGWWMRNSQIIVFLVVEFCLGDMGLGGMLKGVLPPGLGGNGDVRLRGGRGGKWWRYADIRK